ncbi:class I SAM-dependent methyltransferase [Sulfobacillus thermosulfidooxidans]|uniref:class I SAM-dependent methyltransferase n=1 Tax=Sulfobacillus thermosulfidooxidans TaxID=28034 RepID=UPI0006B54FE4|nr:methyltransferase domain-containing protein [Sulfobacillus thermosulfidooxidans]
MKRQWGLGLLGALGLGFIAVRVNGKLRPKPMPVQIEQFFLTNPLRVSYFGPRDALRLAGNLEGLRVLEIGTGVGVILEEIAKRVGEGGQAFGVDIQSDAIAKTEQRLSQHGLMSRTGLATANALEMPWTDGSMDRVIMVAMLGEIPSSHRVEALKEAGRVLNRDGKLVITEFWPDPHFIPLPKMVRLLRQAGFNIVDVYQKPLLYSISAKKEV